MRVRLLGVAAGGGLPQRNCRCRNCQAAQHGQTASLGECSLAFSPDEANWYLVNAAADIARQLARWPELHPRSGIRSAPIRGVIVTDGELDHVLGLLRLREGMRWTFYATPAVASMLEKDLRLLPALRRYADVAVRALAPDEPLSMGEGTSQVEVRLVEIFRERASTAMEILWVIPDYYVDFLKPCMNGWGRTFITVAPDGRVLPCPAASVIPGLCLPRPRITRFGGSGTSLWPSTASGGFE